MKEGNNEAVVELIAPRPLRAPPDGLSGFVAYEQAGQDFTFAPDFTARLLTGDGKYLLKLEFSLSGEETIKGRREDFFKEASFKEAAKENYALLKAGLPGDKYKNLRRGLELMEAVARSVRFEPVGGAAVAPREPDEEIWVGNARELLAAIGPDRTIRLKQGVYDLTADAAGETKHHRSREVHDGFDRVIHGVEGLRIVGTGISAVRIGRGLLFSAGTA